MASERTIDRWRREFHPARGGLEGALESVAESAPAGDEAVERIRRAKEAMIQLIKDQYGGDGALLDAAKRIAITGEEAVGILAEPQAKPTLDQFSALETIVAFDGTRPSFLLKDNAIDFDSSFNKGDWQDVLNSRLSMIAEYASCVGRVEMGEVHIGTAFLVAPTLAFTNRHVAQAIARFGDSQMVIKHGIHLDFGREEWNGKKSYDRRNVEAVLFAGKDKIVPPINHNKLDLAIIRVSASQLGGAAAQRFRPLADMTKTEFEDAGAIATIGYPGGPAEYVPQELQTEFGSVLRRLLEGDGGAKRFAPGKPMTDVDETGFASWTVAHDASTINGNSGSPVAVLGSDKVKSVGIHYGGSWGGERANWAHLLKLVADQTGYGTQKSLSEFCKAEGITP
jgi:V8-like Glu-specific endopeptidase